jgi:membrane fusion protein, multidrug efflux system
MKRFVFLAGIICALAYSASCKNRATLANLPEPGASSTASRIVRVARLQSVESSDAIQATATTAPRASTKVMPVVPGLIISLPVQEGDVVKKGQVLATIDQRNYKLTLRQAEVAMEQARLAIDATTREKERFARLMKEDATAKAQFDQVMDRARGAEIALKQTQVARDMAQKALGDTVLRAPYNGVVIKRLVSLGDYATSMPPTVILVMMDISTLELKISLPEPELPRVNQGASLTAKFSSLNESYQTTILRIVRNVDPMTRSFEAVAELPNEKLLLKPGLFADVTITTSTPRKRLLAPSQAVIDEGSGLFSVFVNQGGVARRVEVKVMTASSEQIEILAGLQGQEEVILDASGLLDGDAIQAKEGPLPAKAPAAEATR